MATETNEPRALAAALAGPAFTTQAGGAAMHVANRHVERWAPEAGASRVHSLRSLGFVDRLVAPWIETAQRSAALRMFSQYVSNGVTQRDASQVSWVFPRPWYQDELDWMAAARQTHTIDQSSQFLAASSQVAAPTVLTTRGTYVRPASSQLALPSALYEYVAPSLSFARPEPIATHDAYTSLIPAATSQASQMMSHAMAPLFGGTAPTAATRMSPGLRAVLTTMIGRIARQDGGSPATTRLAGVAPELVTPPAPRAGTPNVIDEQPAALQAMQLAERYAEQHLQIAELQRVARVVGERERVARAAQPIARQEASTSSSTAPAPSRTTEPTPSPALSAERQRIEERIRERLVETQRAREQAQQAQAPIVERATQVQRLHEQSREAAARDARQSPIAEAPKSQPAATVEPSRVPVEIANAMAALPPELASYIGQRPERAIQAIGELNEALRAVQLMARTAASGASVETTRGPRLVMPAGLGGLVSTIDRAPQLGAPQTSVAPQPMRAPGLMFAPSYVAQSPTSALGATTSSSPAAIHHVAWADRWLARFAGARSQSLDVLSASSARPESRLQALAAAAPGGVFVAPTFDIESADARVSTTATRTRSDEAGSLPQSSVRIDDSAETPDDVFAAISAAASRSRTPAPAREVAPTTPTQRATFADLIAHATPNAPAAGLSAQLASSPFASALRHMMPLGAAPAFDVRALFAESLSASFLSGLLAPATRELEVAAQLPAWAAWSERPATLETGVPGREVADWQATYVAPEASDPTAVTASVEAAQTSAAASPAHAEALAPLMTLRSALLSWDIATTQAAAGAPAAESASTGSASLGSARAMIEAMSLPMLGELAAVRESQSQQSWTSPGMTADRAHAWSVAQERSTADLAFDFVTPELVLAARVYGLGPTEAAQAARLAIAGPGQLTAMAGTVDRTFVQALAMDAQHREATHERQASGWSASGWSASGWSASDERSRVAASQTAAAQIADGVQTESGAQQRAAAASLVPITAFPTAQSSSTGTSFGVERRAPRGAFLWPSTTVGALGLHAAAPDGQQSMSVAALELLAAQAVAELGTYAAYNDWAYNAARASSTTAHVRTSAVSPELTAVESVVAGDHSASTTDRRGAQASSTAVEPTERDVLDTATTLVPMARRSKFEAMYLALGQTSAGRNYAPAARAARALALAGRGDETITARERAAIAWDVMPQLFVAPSATEDEAGQPLSTGAVAQRALDRSSDRGRRAEISLEYTATDARPGLGALSARAGEALSSYVAPSAATPAAATSGSSPRESGAVLRAPTAAQELVRTGRPTGRHGGGEVEIPAWFENAARKMFEDRSGGVGSDISLAELTFVNAAPPSQIAASTRGAPSASHGSPSPQPAKSAGTPIDVDKIANDVYQQILVLMDAARARNGEPYL